MVDKLGDISVFVLSEELSNFLWDIIKQWEYFDKDTIGKQLIRAADTISANIAECYGRYHYKDKQKFGYYARGSFEETKYCLRKCGTRKLLTTDQSRRINLYAEKIDPKLNALINTFKYPGFRNKPPIPNS